MKLTFLGTRGNIEARTRRHYRHSALLVTCRRRRVMVDCGADWRRRLAKVRPDAIVITHAHPDHAGGLTPRIKYPVHATAECWRTMRGPVPAERKRVEPGMPVAIRGITFEAIPVQHSVLAPAVGYRISCNDIVVFYVPDLLGIPERASALRGIRVYVGDGASVLRPIVRRSGATSIGHTSIRTQLEWCAAEHVTRAIFTHCGSGIVRAAAGEAEEHVRRLGADVGVEASVAFDGMVRVLR